MGKTMYLECATGISGDMFVAALLDLGADPLVLKEALDSLHVEGADVRIRRVKKAGVDACDFSVLLDKAHENHDHDMAYLYGHLHGHDGAGQEEKNSLMNERRHDHSHVHEHRGLREILDILHRGRISEKAEKLAEKVFRILAEAEGKAHGVPAEKVHFHEVGALDSILDIVAAAVCMDSLNITEVIIPQITEGRGTIRCRHGILPVPVPAVVNIAEAYRLPLHITEEQGEFITPTGAAIAAAVRTGEKLPERFRILKTGLGAGKRDYRTPGILRAFFIEKLNAPETDHICKLESNIDDCTGEMLGYVMERLLEAGARDVHYTPVYMKKNRPAYQLNVICAPEDVPTMETIIFEETTTIGIRRLEMERTVLERQMRTVRTPWGDVRAKGCRISETIRWYPEYRDVANLARKAAVSCQEVYRAALEACGKEKER